MSGTRLVLAVLVPVAGLAVLAVVLQGATSAPGREATGVPVAGATADPAAPTAEAPRSGGAGVTPAARLEEPVARQVLGRFLERLPDVLSRRPSERAPLSLALATESFADELRGTAEQNDWNGVDVEGAAEVLSLRVLGRAGATDGTVTVEVCLDNSGVRIVDAQGRSVQPPQGRTRQLYFLRSSSDGWQIAGQGFTDDPDC